MTTATHTPGPWKNGGIDWMISQKHGIGWRYATIRNREHDVATVWCDEDDAEQAANVALVTAAPEMLEALRYVYPLLRRLSEESPTYDADGVNVEREAADEVARAIAIATSGGAA